MVVLCLRFRTGTQILIYFPVLLQISSVTLGQLLWEKQVKTPKYLRSLICLSKRGIAADAQMEKHVEMLIEAKTTPKLTGCCPITFWFFFFPISEHQQTIVPLGKWLSSDCWWKMSRRWLRSDHLLVDIMHVLQSRQPWELLPTMVSSFCSIFISDSFMGHTLVSCLATRCMEKIQWSAGLHRDFWVWNIGAPGSWHPAWFRRERSRNNHITQGQVHLT